MFGLEGYQEDEYDGEMLAAEYGLTRAGIHIMKQTALKKWRQQIQVRKEELVFD
jgi:hypothetical protein